jgi:hypothetical protein
MKSLPKIAATSPGAPTPSASRKQNPNAGSTHKSSGSKSAAPKTSTAKKTSIPLKNGRPDPVALLKAAAAAKSRGADSKGSSASSLSGTNLPTKGHLPVDELLKFIESGSSSTSGKSKKK